MMGSRARHGRLPIRFPFPVMPLSSKAWSAAPSYGEVFYARATGQAPEMESSKAAAKKLRGIVVPQARILDVGCGSGHYLRSLRREFPFPFFYEGSDITPEYIALGKKAYANDPLVRFTVASVEELPYEPKSFDVVMCCNILLHLPSVTNALRELWRVTRSTLLVRTQIGNSTFRIKQVPEPDVMNGKEDPLFGADGEPKTCHYYNIYSERYIRWFLGSMPDVEDVLIERDMDYDPRALGAGAWPEDAKPDDLTEVMGGWQVHKYILQPWSFLRVTRTIAS